MIKNSRLKVLIYFPLIPILLSFSGCMFYGNLPEVANLAEVDSNSTILVGKIQLSPPLEGAEQQTHWNVIGDGQIKNRMVLYTHPDNTTLESGESPYYYARRMKNSIVTSLGETYFLKAPNNSTNILAGMVMLNYYDNTDNALFFPGGLRINIEPEDRAVYTGTLIYHRNDFHEIIKVELKDEYQQANKEFKERYGSKAQLKKSLLTKIK